MIVVFLLEVRLFRQTGDGAHLVDRLRTDLHDVTHVYTMTSMMIAVQSYRCKGVVLFVSIRHARDDMFMEFRFSLIYLDV